MHFKQCEIGQQFEGQFTEGGALSIINSRLTLTNSVFEGVKGENGACVYSDTRISFYSSLRERLLALPTALDMSISNCRFLDNQASSSGGVLFLKNVNTQILNSQFLQNLAKEGGVIYADIRDQGKKVQIQESSFTKNNATKKGAIDVTVSQPIYFQNNDFEENRC